MGVTAAVIGAVAGAATATNSIVQGNKQAKQAQKAADRDAAAMAKAESEAQAASATDAVQERSRTDAQDLLRRRALANRGRASTLLTGPTGLGGEPSGERKTLLGL